VEFPLGKNADVGWQEPRDAGLKGGVRALEEEDALRTGEFEGGRGEGGGGGCAGGPLLLGLG